MGVTDTVHLLIVILYVTGGLILLVTAYIIYIRKYRKRGRMEMLNNIVFTTSRYDVYSSKTQFLLELPKACDVELDLLDEKENPVRKIIQKNMESGQHIIPFDPAEFANGIYFLSLKAAHSSVLRKITIENK